MTVSSPRGECPRRCPSRLVSPAASLGTIPADLTQYYVHAFRIMQKLAYPYGWRELLSDMDEVDDDDRCPSDVLRRHALGVGGAAQSLTAARLVAMPAFQKQLTVRHLRRPWYPVMKQCLRFHRHQPHEEELCPGCLQGYSSHRRCCVGRHDFRAPVPVHPSQGTCGLPPPGVDAEV